MAGKSLFQRPFRCLALGLVFVALSGMAGCPELLSCRGDHACFERDGKEDDDRDGGGGGGGGGGY